MGAKIIEEGSKYLISEMAETLERSEIIKLASEINEKIKNGERIYNLTIGDFDPSLFPIPDELKKNIAAAYDQGQTNYPPPEGIVDLRRVVSDFLFTRGGLEYSENEILISGGGRPLIYAAYQALLDPGDSVIFPVPSWNNNHYSHLARAKQIPVQTKEENNFMLSADEISPYLEEATLIAVCSPLNPTGTAFSKKGLQDICELIVKENKKRNGIKKLVYLLYDQIYWTLTYGDTVHYNPVDLVPEVRPFTICIDGMSKSFAATGLRIGWGFGPQELINKMRTILSHIGAWAPKPEQVGAANFLRNDEAVDRYLKHIRSGISERLEAFYKGFKTLKSLGFNVDAIAPQAAMYLTVKVDLAGYTAQNGTRLNTTADITKYLLDEAKIALVPFSAFGASKSSRWYRLSVGMASISDIDNFFESFKKALVILV